MTEQIQKPCLVETSQGFSVSYKTKYLYSKYAPKKLILTKIQELELLPGSIILCNSPLCFYGLKELCEKLPENSIIFFCEFDQELYKFAKIQFSKYLEENPISKDKIEKICFLTPEELYQLPVKIIEKNIVFNCGFKYNFTYKRLISIDFSAGTQFYQDLYLQLRDSCINSILTFISNRMTLTKFGRRYSQNFFKNLKKIPDAKSINTYLGKINKPIIICGAGQSLNSGITDFKSTRENYFIICVDTSLKYLLKNGIDPDAVFVEEAQFIITKAFLGCLNKNYKFQIFQSLSSVAQLSKVFPITRMTYFTSLFSKADFLLKLKQENLIPKDNPGFGSVGLTALFYGLLFRSSTSIPIYIYGLDFSYSAGLSHVKESMANTYSLLNYNRIKNLNNYNFCFGSNVQKILDKNQNQFYSTKNLLSYAYLFTNYFSSQVNIYDSSDCGINLEIPRKKPESLKKLENKKISEENDLEENLILKEKINEFFLQEINALKELKDILTGRISLSEEEATKKIKVLAEPREYLYLHFPDGFYFSPELSFLKRIRTEIDFFLKIFQD